MFAYGPVEFELPVWFWLLVLLVMFTVTFVPWLSFAYWTARVASRKGHSFGGYFMVSVVLYPLSFATAAKFESLIPGMTILALPVLSAYFVDDRKGTQRSQQDRTSPGPQAE